MTGLVGAYRAVLGNRALARLFGAFLVGALVDWVPAIALLLVAWETTGGDPIVVGLVGAVRMVPFLFLGIPAGYLADRFDRRSVLLVASFARAATMAVLALLAATGAGIGVLVGATMLATTISVVFQPAIGALVPVLARDERDLGPATAVYASIDIVALLAGPALAAILFALVPSLPLAFAVNAVGFVLVGWIVAGLPARGPAVLRRAASPPMVAPADGRIPTDAQVRNGAAAIAAPASARRPVVALLAFELVHSFVIGALVVLTTIIAFEVVRAGEAATAVLNAAVGIGGIVGVAAGGVLVLGRRVAPPFLGGVLLVCGGLVGLGTVAQLPGLVLAVLAIALGSLIASVVGGTLYQRMVDDAVRGRMVAVLDWIWEVVYAAGALLVPTLVAVAGLGPVLVVCAAALLVTALAFLLVLGPWGTQPTGPDAVRAHLGRVPALAGLPPARLARAERRAQVLGVAAGPTVIAQGGVADRYYAIAAGTVEVTQVPPDGGAARVLRRMGTDEGFGEIGILAGSPRTATVTAVTDCTLVALDARDFLALVGVTEPGAPALAGLPFPGYR
ncbi:MAG: cyclic nucleotide-binding domain-containing protein [Chloroflexota bacterium]